MVIHAILIKKKKKKKRKGIGKSKRIMLIWYLVENLAEIHGSPALPAAHSHRGVTSTRPAGLKFQEIGLC